MDQSRIRKIVLSIIFLIICSLSIYFHVIQTAVIQLLNSGVNSNFIYLGLAIPVITLIISFCRTIIGISISSIYIPIIITTTALIIGLNLTLISIILTILLAVSAKTLLNDFHFHFGSKLSIIISSIIIILLISFPYLQNIPFLPIQEISLSISIWGVLIISLINEKFFNYKVNKNSLASDLKQTFKTIIFSVICYFILGGSLKINTFQWEFSWLHQALISYPDVIIITLIFNIIIGQYTGLRLDEIIRFRKLIFKNK